jgi:hypothetical protein
MLTKVRATAYPAFGGPMLINALGVPRYWATVWASFLPADLAPSTLGKKLIHLDSFYRQSDHSLGLGGLDDALADINVEALCSALEAYFLSLRSPSAVTPATEERWQTALQFVIETVPRLTRSSLAMHRLSSSRDRLLNVRHASTHRFIVVHDIGETPSRESTFIDHYSASEVESNVIKSLQLTRAALLYFVDMIAQHEQGKGRGLIMPLVIPQHHEIRGDEDTD